MSRGRILSDEEMDAQLAAEHDQKRMKRRSDREALVDSLANAGRDAGTIWEERRAPTLGGAAVILWLCVLAIFSIPGAAIAFVMYYLRR